VADGQQTEPTGEPHPLRSLWRLLQHGIHIAFYFVLHWGIKKLAEETGQQDEVWAKVVITGASVMFVISFFVIAGTELIADCWDAIRSMWRRIRE
jgi:hypothetical protein